MSTNRWTFNKLDMFCNKNGDIIWMIYVFDRVHVCVRNCMWDLLIYYLNLSRILHSLLHKSIVWRENIIFQTYYVCLFLLKKIPYLAIQIEHKIWFMKKILSTPKQKYELNQFLVVNVW